MIQYDSYHFTVPERVRYLAAGYLVIGGIIWLFYQNWYLVLFAAPLTLVYLNKMKISQKEKRKWELNLQFKDGIVSLSGSLNAGYSIENSFKEAVRDLTVLYGENSYIVREFTAIDAAVHLNRTVEEALADFADRSGVTDIRNFSEVFATAKRTGGDIIQIIKNTGDVISSRIEIIRDIRTMLAAKKMESRIMNVMPAGIIVYLQVFSPGFLQPLYHNVFGVAVMTVILTVYIGAVWLTQKIVSIEV